MGKIIDITGQRFGRLTALEYSACNKWMCICDCGNVKAINSFHLRHGHTLSCGCLHSEMMKARNTTHGRTGTLEFITWQGMIERCCNTKSSGYSNYGGRGIKVCDRWLDGFENFLEDMGEKPSSEHSIDRIDVNRDYEPSNCRWATRVEQANNKRDTVYFEYQGERLTIRDICNTTGIKPATLRKRMYAGMGVEEAVNNPVANPNRCMHIYNGELKPLKKWCRELHLNAGTMMRRVAKGMSFEEAVNVDIKDNQVKIMYDGCTRTISQWAIALGVKKCTIYTRIKRGWSIEDALTKPTYK